MSQPSLITEAMIAQSTSKCREYGLQRICKTRVGFTRDKIVVSRVSVPLRISFNSFSLRSDIWLLTLGSQANSLIIRITLMSASSERRSTVTINNRVKQY